jgi:hypothetical protein
MRIKEDFCERATVRDGGARRNVTLLRVLTHIRMMSATKDPTPWHMDTHQSYQESSIIRI